jgi:hypothetical protein
VGCVSLAQLDAELTVHAPAEGLMALAIAGLRGELLFATPTLLVARPQLLAYYRLMLGYSQKFFYGSTTGLSRFKSMETKGLVSPRNAADIPALCRTMNRCAAYLVGGVHAEPSRALLHDLSLLTLGAQFRGGANNDFGVDAITRVFGIMRDIVQPHVAESSAKGLAFLNASKRKIEIRFAADPDIVVLEALANDFHPLLAIEVKGGKDVSNVHNRLGEAEKSHQQAKAAGYRECWTIINAAVLPGKARAESPSTTRFFDLQSIADPAHAEHRVFKSHLQLILGIPDSAPNK